MAGHKVQDTDGADQVEYARGSVEDPGRNRRERGAVDVRGHGLTHGFHTKGRLR